MKALLSRAQLGKMEHLSMRQSAPAGVISQSRINECEGQFTIAHLIEPVLWGDWNRAILSGIRSVVCSRCWVSHWTHGPPKSAR